MLIHHVHAKFYCEQCSDGRFLPGRFYRTVDGTLTDELGQVYENVRSLEDINEMFPDSLFIYLEAHIEIY